MKQTNEIKVFTGVGLDFETGGLDCTKCACTQIALQAIRLDSFEIVEQLSCYIAPYNKQDIGTPKRKVLRSKYEVENKPAEPMEIGRVALDYSGITMETLLEQGMDINQTAKDTIEFIKRNTLSKGAKYKPILIGQNITFDIGFLTQLMNYAGLIKELEKVLSGKKDFYGNFQPDYIDTIHLARLAYAHDSSMVSYKLELIAEKLGIELDDAHNADADVTATLNVVQVLSNRLRCSGGQGGVVIHKGEKSRVHFKI
ncbi:PolC-type DNA polymerase III [Bacteroides sp. 51]|uniref:3'-5' exonuclease n=1 Tax=Bacteroides sp. 51 TaxID=2302938 RepID=UPI0013D0FEDA|nr:3'-5' exonuclease [Bacteroides sp. 51]NDV80861.1 3'-5' exonuclease [Bacteroides sp. 51]